jgi:hypothetical protein
MTNDLGIDGSCDYLELTMLEMVSLAVDVELTMLMVSKFPMGRSRWMSLKEDAVLQTDCPATETGSPPGNFNASLNSAGIFGNRKMPR